MEPAPAAIGRGGRVIVWLQDELRLHDNPALSFAAKDADSVLIVYVFDRRLLDRKSQEYVAFLKESILDLQSSLREMGSDLVLLDGPPEICLPDFCERTGARAVIFHRAISLTQIEIENTLIDKLSTSGKKSVRMWSNTMYELEETPFNLRTIPWEYEQFEKEVRAEGKPSKPLPPVDNLPAFPKEETSDTFPAWLAGGQSSSALRGGERAALSRLEECLKADVQEGKKFVWNIRPWFERGCLSPRTVKAKLLSVGRFLAPERLKLIETELILWDFFRFISLVRSIMNAESHMPKEQRSVIP
eukprot:Plantae.Rhodophyta-Purpureofilum_apyrenoidigerum.ctg14623.p2 GENE.Plantae.Rhodophyta-Purpureofilum_apyrenoidigerum.ctg14623~~Plantae.Rhodophyta-Purpureofilum_apyrenoidigerum.ctg14623.p2  ORF type:complete len:344 (+),score=60.01 Plantae.Rhodophyta-Purpureofilum_apyrenoidigerum.ctg14623:127-1032(+)